MSGGDGGEFSRFGGGPHKAKNSGAGLALLPLGGAPAPCFCHANCVHQLLRGGTDERWASMREFGGPESGTVAAACTANMIAEPYRLSNAGSSPLLMAS